MRLRTGLPLLICCAVITACTANGPKGPAATVTTPAVGRPPAPVSAQAALASEAFTPYAVLGAADNDGLAPGDTYDALHTACMSDAGYGQYAADEVYPVRTNEQQFVSANQQALDAGIREYKAAFAKALKTSPPCSRPPRPRPTCPDRPGPATTAPRPSPPPATPDGRRLGR